MTTNNPRASTDRANVLPLPPETTSPPAHSAPAVSRRTIMLRTATAFASAALVAAPSIVPAALAPTPSDPIFAALENWRRVDASDDEDLQAWGAAYMAVLRTRPCTPAGLAALTGILLT
jgi:hypothetical protein